MSSKTAQTAALSSQWEGVGAASTKRKSPQSGDQVGAGKRRASAESADASLGAGIAGARRESEPVSPCAGPVGDSDDVVEGAVATAAAEQVQDSVHSCEPGTSATLSQACASTIVEISTADGGGPGAVAPRRSTRRRDSEGVEPEALPQEELDGESSLSQQSDSSGGVDAADGKPEVLLPALPEGWEARSSRKDGAVYYLNLLNEDEKVWAVPTAAARPAVASAESGGAGQRGDDSRMTSYGRTRVDSIDSCWQLAGT
jgi:hypothetical protein